MIDLMGPPDNTPDPQASNRRSFRSRLIKTVGPAFAGALLLLGLIAWFAVYVALQRSAVEVLEVEATEVEADVVHAGGTLQTDGHTWTEVHHRLAAERVDPIFVQVFDRHNRILRASVNVDSLSALYPERPLALETPYDWVPTLRTIEVGGRTLYYLVRPIVRDDRTLGYIQVAREVPDYGPTLWTFAAALSGTIILLFGGLLMLVAWASRRVLRPLRHITEFAEEITSAELDERVEIPVEADHETALLAGTLNSLLDRLEDRFDALRTFTSNAAHELQTPLTALQGHVEIALRRSRSAESYESTLRILDRKLGDVVRTVRALLTLTRLDRGEELSTQPVSLSPLVEEEVETARAGAEEKGLSLRLVTEEVWVEGQADLLRKAVKNLVENAVKYTDEGSILLTVATEGSRAVVRCRDTGAGIASEDLPRVSDRFYRSPEASGTESNGSGLGLALVRRIVAVHDGELRVESELGEGSQFEIVMPAVPPPDTATEAPAIESYEE